MGAARTRSIVGLALLVALAVFAAVRFRTTTAITHFLVSPHDVKLGRISRALADSELTRTMVISVEASSTTAALKAAADLEVVLQADDEVQWVRTGVEAGTDKAVYELYEPRRFGFAAQDAHARATALSDKGMDAAVAALKRQLAGPMAVLVKRLAPSDPWLFFLGRTRAMQSAQTDGMQVVDGRFVDRDGTRAIVLLATRHSAFSSEHQGPLEARLQRAFADLHNRDGSITIERSAVHRFALQSEADIRADIQRISVISTVGIVVLFLVVFGSLRLLLLGLLTLAAGVITATAVGLALFGELHGLTLAFGATLIGVCIDYPAHYFAHHVVDPHPDGAAGTLHDLWPGLAVGAATTVAGFAGLAAASFPGVREIGVFSGVGIAAAVLTTRYVLPGLMPDRVPTPAVTARSSQWLAAAVEKLAGHRRPLLLLPALALVVAAIGLPQLTWVDDTHALNRLQPAMLEEDERVRARVSRVDVARMVVATGADMEEALQHNDEVARRLEPLAAAGTLDYRTLHAFLWSAAAQNANTGALYDPAVVARMEAALERGGFRAPAFAPMRQALTSQPPRPLTYDELLDSPLGPAVRTFVVELGGSPAVLTFVQAAADPATIDDALAGLQGAVYFDQRRFLADNYRGYRERIQQIVMLGLLGVLFILLVRYRKPRQALAAFAPALLAALFTLAVLALAGHELHLLHLVGILLVLSMGVDYGVFLAEAARQGRGQAATLLGLVIACISTVLAFGLLGLSSNPAMQAVGLTTGIGVLASLVLAPIALILTANRRQDEGEP